MPRKPSSIFLIVEPKTDLGAAAPNLGLKAYRLPLAEGDDADRVAAAYYAGEPAGTRFYLIDDTKADAREVRLELAAVEDPRLEQEP